MTDERKGRHHCQGTRDGEIQIIGQMHLSCPKYVLCLVMGRQWICQVLAL
jgi:late competence protein required for DNA uptake (superfamily II DNA/RNA helicase)